MSVDIIKVARESAGNGTLTMGFISSADPGLPKAQWIRVPAGFKKSGYTELGIDVEEKRTGEIFSEVLFTDASTVAKISVPDVLKPFVLANRAYSVAYGYATTEILVRASAVSTAEKDKINQDFDFVAKAAAIKNDIGTISSLFTTLNYYHTNHNTTGSVLPRVQIKILRQTLSLPDVVTDRQITDAVYVSGHAADKRCTLRSILPPDQVAKLVKPNVLRAVRIADLDVWVKKRTDTMMIPAGCAPVGLLKVFLGHIMRSGVLGFSPAPAAVVVLEQAIAAIKANPGYFHPGARYLFGVDVETLAMIEDLKVYVGIFGGFCMAAKLAPSAWAPVHVQKLIAEHGDPQWTNMGTMFGKGIEITEDRIKAAAGAYGIATGASITDPTIDAAKYKAETDAYVNRFKSLKL